LLNSGRKARTTERVETYRKLYPFKAWSPMQEWLGLWERHGGDAYVEKKFFDMRLGHMWTGHRLASINYLPQRYLTECPVCHADTPETVDHILFECATWEEPRVAFLESIDILFPGLIADRGRRVMGVFGRHPVSLTSVGLDENPPVEEEEAIKRRAWILARAPTWVFMSETMRKRSGIISEIIESHLEHRNHSSDDSSDDCSDDSSDEGSEGSISQSRSPPRVGQTCRTVTHIRVTAPT